MPWFVKCLPPPPRTSPWEKYIEFDTKLRRGHASFAFKNNPHTATRFETKEAAEGALLLLAAQVPVLIGTLRTEHRIVG